MNNHSFYYNAYKEHGISAKGVKWSSQKRQFLRFKILIDLIKKELENSTVLDIGSGYGDLISYFQKSNIYPKSYTGIDCEEFIIELSKKRFPNSKFYKKNLLKDDLPKADYYVCSGALNILREDDFLDAIKKCYEESDKGFIFNTLTEAYIHELTIFDVFLYCQNIANEVIIKDDYLENDYTIFMKK